MFDEEFEPPINRYPTASERLETAVVRAACAASRDPSYAKKVLWQLAADRTGEKCGPINPNLHDLRRAGFPLAVRTARVKVCSVYNAAFQFTKTPLAEAWSKSLTEDPEWGESNRKAVVFSWVGWGLCALHDVHDVPGGTISVPVPDGSLYIHPFVTLAGTAEWEFNRE